jgi:hypothetical protein
MAALTHTKTGLKLVLISYKLYVSALDVRTNIQTMKPTRLFESQDQVLCKFIIPGNTMLVKFPATTWKFETSYKIRLHSVRPTHCQPLTHQKRPKVCDLRRQLYLSLQTLCYLKHESSDFACPLKHYHAPRFGNWIFSRLQYKRDLGSRAVAQPPVSHFLVSSFISQYLRTILVHKWNLVRLLQECSICFRIETQ